MMDPVHGFSKMSLTLRLLLSFSCLSGILALITISSPGYASTDNNNTTTVIESLTSNMLAANGPLPGNLSLYAEEVACSAALNNSGYYSSLNGA